MNATRLNKGDEQVNPTSDPQLQSLKALALRGGDRGPHFDRGALTVIEQIEREGSYTPDRREGLICLAYAQRNGPPLLLTAEESAEAGQVLAGMGLTLEQGIEFFSGVSTAQQLLFRYRKQPDGQQTPPWLA